MIFQKSSFHNVKSWLPYVETQDPSVLLLLDSGKGNSSKGTCTVLFQEFNHHLHFFSFLSLPVQFIEINFFQFGSKG